MATKAARPGLSFDEICEIDLDHSSNLGGQMVSRSRRGSVISAPSAQTRNYRVAGGNATRELDPKLRDVVSRSNVFKEKVDAKDVAQLVKDLHDRHWRRSDMTVGKLRKVYGGRKVLPAYRPNISLHAVLKKELAASSA